MSDTVVPLRPGKGWRGDSEGHARVGKIGGDKLASNRDHMAAIGRKGGLVHAAIPGRMSALGKLGAQSRAANLESQRKQQEVIHEQ